LDALTFISYLGALTNASLVYLMRSYPVSGHVNTAANTVQEALQAVGNATHTKTLPPARPFSAVYTTRLQEAHGDSSMVWNTLLGALLCALASEHGFVLVRAIVRHLFERILWQGSKEEAYVRGMNWHLRKDYIESQGGQNFEKEIVRLDRRRQQDHDDIMHGELNNTNLINADFWRNGNGKFEAAASRKRQ
jgi:anoctamin-10